MKCTQFSPLLLRTTHVSVHKISNQNFSISPWLLLWNQCNQCRKLRSSILKFPDPVSKSAWSWFHLLLWFHLMCKSSCVHFTCFMFEVGWCVCMLDLLDSHDAFRHHIMIQFDTIILTILSSNIMMNFVYFIRFCLLNTPFDLHVVLEYTKFPIISYMMLRYATNSLFILFD